ncbi:hypothetical protein ACFQ9X_11690 [Catenulispora yoronensis]
MRQVLEDAELCDWPDKITVLDSRAPASELLVDIEDLAEATTEVLLLYYVGHGDLTRRGELCLTVRGTRPDRLRNTSLPWESVAECLQASPAGVRITILDCCFAGRAIEALSGTESTLLANLTDVRGIYTLTATMGNNVAHVPRGELQEHACTSFTDTLVGLMREGLPGKPTKLSFEVLFPELKRRLQVAKLPLPNQRGTDTVAHFPFVANRALRPGAVASPGHGQRTTSRAALLPSERVDGLVDECLQTLREMESPADRQRTLSNVAEVLTAADPAKARILVELAANEAERVKVLAPMALALADIDQLRAIELIDLIADRHPVKYQTMARAAVLMATARPRESQALAAAAIRLTSRVVTDSNNEHEFGLAIDARATAAAITDPDRGERLLRSMPSTGSRSWAMSNVATAIAVTDPERAERLANSIAESDAKVAALIGIAAVIAPHRRTEALADAAAATLEQVERGRPVTRAVHLIGTALPRIIRVVVPRDLNLAEYIVRLFPEHPLRAHGLARLARQIAGFAPGFVTGYLTEAEEMVPVRPHPRDFLGTMALLAAGWSQVRAADAVTFANRAEILARDGASDPERVTNLALLAARWAERP